MPPERIPELLYQSHEQERRLERLEQQVAEMRGRLNLAIGLLLANGGVGLYAILEAHR